MASKRQFIDKKKSVTFQLVHRSQRDPLAADETASQFVLSDPSSGPGGAEVSAGREERTNYGIFFDDDYDYLQHLRVPDRGEVVWAESAAGRRGTVDGASGLQLPASVFASRVEESVGLLNRAAPDSRPPDDDALDLSDGEEDVEALEDDFLQMAGGLASGEESDEWEDDTGDDESAFSSEQHVQSSAVSASRRKKRPGSARSRMSQFSTTSCGVLSTVEMERLNEHFENVMGEYDDMEVGALDTEDIQGFIDPNSSRLLQLAEDFQKAKLKHLLDDAGEDHARSFNLVDRIEDEDAEDSDRVVLTVYENKRDDRLDCESVISSYSNKKNRPALIEDRSPRRIQLDSRGRVVGEKPRLTRKSLAELNNRSRSTKHAGDSDNTGSAAASDDSSFGGETLVSRISVLSVRPAGESSDERRARKHELKALRRERIQERKANRCLAAEMSRRQMQSQGDKISSRQIIAYE